MQEKGGKMRKMRLVEQLALIQGRSENLYPNEISKLGAQCSRSKVFVSDDISRLHSILSRYVQALNRYLITSK